MRAFCHSKPDRAPGAARAAVVALAALVAFTALPAAPSRADETLQSRKIKRQIAVFERILDQVLVDSQNFLVHGTDNSRGIYLSEFGVVVSFEASLIEKDWSFTLPNFKFRKNGEGWTITSDDGKGGKTVNHKGRLGGKETPDASEAPEADEGDESAAEDSDSGTPDDAKRVEKLHELTTAKEKKMYENGKQEIIDALLEYGDTITTLRDDQSIAIVAFLKDSEYFQDNKISRLVLKAKMGDLRAFTAGTLSEATVSSKIVQEEY